MRESKGRRPEMDSCDALYVFVLIHVDVPERPVEMHQDNGFSSWAIVGKSS